MTAEPRPRRLPRAAALCLLVAPVIESVSIVVMPTLSSKGATQYAALSHHRSEWIAWLIIDGIALALFVGCALALAGAIADRHRRWAYAGAGLLIVGLADLLFMNGINAVGPEMIRGGADPAQMIALLDRLAHSPMTSLLDALSMTTSIGLVLLAIGLRRSRTIPAWSVAAIIVGAIADGVGFAAGTKPLAAAAFVVLLAGFATVARALLDGRPSLDQPTVVTRDAGVTTHPSVSSA